VANTGSYCHRIRSWRRASRRGKEWKWWCTRSETSILLATVDASHSSNILLSPFTKWLSKSCRSTVLLSRLHNHNLVDRFARSADFHRRSVHLELSTLCPWHTYQKSSSKPVSDASGMQFGKVPIFLVSVSGNE